MNAGRMDRVIVIRNPPSGQNEVGEPNVQGAVVCTVPAEYMRSRGREFFGSLRDVTEAYDKFRIRYRNDVFETQLVEYGSPAVIYQIHRVDELHRNEGLELTCRLIK